MCIPKKAILQALSLSEILKSYESGLSLLQQSVSESDLSYIRVEISDSVGNTVTKRYLLPKYKSIISQTNYKDKVRVELDNSLDFTDYDNCPEEIEYSNYIFTGGITANYLNNGNSDTSKYKITQNYQTVDIKEDNCKPYMGDGNLMFTEDLSKLYTTEFGDKGVNAALNDVTEVTYWFVPYTKSDSTLSTADYQSDLTEYELNHIQEKPMYTTFNKNDTEVYFPINGYSFRKETNNSIFNRCCLVVKFADKSGNEFLGTIGRFYKGMYENGNLVLSKINDESLKASIPWDDYDTEYDYPNRMIIWEYFDSTSNQWTRENTHVFSENGSMYYTYYPYTEWNTYDGSEFNDYYWETTIEHLTPGKFYRFHVRGREVEDISHFQVPLENSRVVSCSPSYINLASPTCNKKSVKFRNDITVNVECDQLCVVETVHSPERLTTVQEWDTFGYKESPQSFTSSGTYTVDVSTASSGDYFCVIAHFSDGTSQISSVGQVR